MTAELWRKVEDTFHEALTIALDARTEWLNTACGEHEELRAEVDGMLAADEKQGIGLEKEVRWAAGALLGEHFAVKRSKRRTAGPA